MRVLLRLRAILTRFCCTMRQPRQPPAPPLLLLLLLLLFLCANSSANHEQRDDDPFNILRAVEAHAVAERNAERAISAAEARARAAEKRADAADAAATASRELALHLQVESNARLLRARQIEEENEGLRISQAAAHNDKQLLVVRTAPALPSSPMPPFAASDFYAAGSAQRRRALCKRRVC
jgi:hypothetical protein